MPNQPVLPFGATSLPYSRKSMKRRERCLESWDYKCVYCGDGLTVATMTFDHLIPRSKGGTNGGKKNGEKNLVPACSPCNMLKGSFVSLEELDQFYKRLKPILVIAQKIIRGEIKPKPR